MDKGKVFKAGIGYTIGNYLQKGIVFLTTPIFARLMTTADFGKYNAFVSYESIFFVVIGLAIHTSYKNAFYRFKDNENPESEIGYKKYLSATMVFLFISLLIWMLLGHFFNKPIAELLGIERPLLYVLIVGSLVSAITNCYSADKGIHFQYKALLAISLVNTALSIGLSIILMKTVFTEKMYIGRILGGILPGVLIYFVIASKYIFSASPRGMKDAMKWGIKYSLPIVPHGISQVVLTQFDRIMIMRIIGDSQAGIYSFAYTIYSMIIVTSSSIEGVWSPWFYSKRKVDDYTSIKKGSVLYILIVFLASVGVILLCPELIHILGSEKYSESIYCAIPIVIGGFFACIYNVPCLVEYYHEKTKLIAASTAFAAILNIILNAIFIPLYGYIAAAYTTLVTYVTYFTIHYVMAIKIEKKDLFSIMFIAICVVFLLFSMIIALMSMKVFVVRLSVLLFIIGLSVAYEEKNYGYINKWMKRVKVINREH